MKKQRIKIKDLLQSEAYGTKVLVKGWVRTKRESKGVAFVALNDGSTINNLQIVVDINNFDENIVKQISTGACVAIAGNLLESPAKGQKVELQATEIEIYGVADPEKYPLQPKEHSLEFLREIAHLRPRTNTFGAIMRVRNAMAFAVHKFFNERGFVYVNTPIITASDCEGAGEMFRVTTLDAINPPKNELGEVDWKEDFFGRQANLTVSGQLEGELAATALGEIYTFGPTFRAENSNTARHLAEFWMIEPEVAFADLDDNMDLAESFLKYLISYALTHCEDDLAFLDQRFSKEETKKKEAERSEFGLIEKLKFVLDNDFQRLTYTEAVDILVKSKPAQKGQFKYPVAWGTDLQSEHERYLVEKHFKKPVILTDYPREIKAFYMKLSDDGKTVRAMDVLFPGIGEIIGGSQREENLEKLEMRMKEVGLNPEESYWYLDTRRYGTCPHAGFGLGFERLILFITGMSNIRDVIPFPRTPQNCEF